MCAQCKNMYALALPQREMESRRGEITSLEREVDRLKVLYMQSFVNGAVSASSN